MKFKIRCPYCGWETKEHYTETECIKEKEVAHRAKYGNNAHDMAFSQECPNCGEDMGGRQ